MILHGYKFGWLFAACQCHDKESDKQMKSENKQNAKFQQIQLINPCDSRVMITGLPSCGKNNVVKYGKPNDGIHLAVNRCESMEFWMHKHEWTD